MADKKPNTDSLQEQQQEQENDNQQSGNTDVNEDQSAIAFDGRRTTEVKGTDAPGLNDGSAASNQDDAGIVDRQSESDLDTSDSNQITFENPESRDIGEDIISGARQTDQIETLQENAQGNPAPENEKEGGPAVVKINNGEPGQGETRS